MSGDHPLQSEFERVRAALTAAGDSDAAIEHIQELEAMASAGHAEAIIWCGICYQFGMLVKPDIEAARRWFELGHQADVAAATFRLGDLHAGEHLTDSDPAIARELFEQACDGGEHAAAFLLAYMHDNGIGGGTARTNATAILDRSARAGSPLAQLALAERLMRGDTVVADPAAAMFWAGHAATQRFPLGAELYRMLAEAGHSPSESAPDLTPDEQLAAPLSPTGRELVDGPRSVALSGLASIAERAHLIRKAAPLIRPSRVVRATAGADARHPARTSGDMAFRAGLADVVVRRYIARVAEIADLPVTRAEPLVVLRYGTDDEYTPHFDYFDGDYAHELERGGQRVRTVLGYLNTVPEGGATGFPMLGLEVPARGGEGLMFDNVGADGAPDSRSLHAGRPVIRGPKWTATLWFREQDFPVA
jgi:prolyl 4-hydroxylase